MKNISRKESGISESEFSMWRALLAFAWVDNVLSLETQKFLQPYLRTVRFSPRQRETLKYNLGKPQNIEDLYSQVTNLKDRRQFCLLARALAWSNGTLEELEAGISKKEADLPKVSNEAFSAAPSLSPMYGEYAKAAAMGHFTVVPTVEVRV